MAPTVWAGRLAVLVDPLHGEHGSGNKDVLSNWQFALVVAALCVALLAVMGVAS
jgi:hypothetical protein